MMMKTKNLLPALLSLLPSSVNAFQTYFRVQTRVGTKLFADEIGIIYGTSTGSTGEAADLICEAFNDKVPGTAAEPLDIDTVEDVTSTLQKFKAIVVGTPTWNTGADTERSGTGWDEIYYGEMAEIQLQNKNVAVFGLGDSVSYGENYADASGELHDVMQSLGCNMMGFVSQDGYQHEASKAIRDGKFCGLMLDYVNEEELSEERVEKWVDQLLSEGFLEGTSSGAATSAGVEPVEAAVSPPISQPTQSQALLEELEIENAKLRQLLEEHSRLLQEEMMASAVQAQPANADVNFTPHYNSRSGRTMWTSADGKKCYFTSDGKFAHNP